MSPASLLCPLQWHKGTPLPAFVGALWTQQFSGRAPLVGRHSPNPTVSCGTPPVSLTSAWQDAILGKEGRSENHHQAGRPEQNLLPCHRWQLCSHPLQRHQVRRDTTIPQLQGLCRALWVNLSEPPHLSCGEEKTILSPSSVPPAMGKRNVTTFQQLPPKKSPLWRIWRNPSQPKGMPGKDPTIPV